MESSQRDRILRALSADSSALRADGVRRMLDVVLEQPLKNVLDLCAAQQALLGALGTDNLRRIATRHVAPGWERYSEAARSSPVRLGELVPPAAQAEIQRLIATTRPPQVAWFKSAIDAGLLRRLLAPVFGSVLANFVKRLPIPGVGAASGTTNSNPDAVGFAERLTRGVQKRTGKLVDVGRSAMGGFGAELEKRLQTAARDFGGAAMELFREALEERLRSEEGRALVQQITENAVTKIMSTPLTEIQKDADALPVDGILGIVPDVVAHAVQHDFVRGIVEGDLRAYLEIEGDRSLRELLDELGLLEHARGLLQTSMDQLAQRLFESPAFGEWLERVLEA
ncbi:MAG TPA: hypothetical protein VI072_30330 [Polyangiaceae bacterium]